MMMQDGDLQRTAVLILPPLKEPISPDSRLVELLWVDPTTDLNKLFEVQLQLFAKAGVRWRASASRRRVEDKRGDLKAFTEFYVLAVVWPARHLKPFHV